MNLPIWKSRAQEDAHLFNPAFCGALSYEFCKSYCKTANVESTELPILFCALPLSLHLDTRDILPDRTATSLYSWLERNPKALVGFAKRAQNITPYIKQGVSYAVSRKCLDFAENGQLILGVNKASFPPKFLENSTHEVRDIVSTTRLLGRWFAGASSSATILASWGISV